MHDSRRSGIDPTASLCVRLLEAVRQQRRARSAQGQSVCVAKYRRDSVLHCVVQKGTAVENSSVDTYMSWNWTVRVHGS